jgi:hypothetical protein
MNIAQKLTPFSQSVLHPAAKIALRSAAVHLGSPDFVISDSALARPGGVNAHLARLTVGVWGGSSQAVAHLLGVAPSDPVARGKAGRGIKTAQQTLAVFPQIYGRLRRWSEWVFASEWSQAQLLQVMEEVELMVTEALLWDYLAAVGSYVHLGEQIAKFEKDEAQAHALRLGLTAGLETPDGRLIEALAVGVAAETLQKTFGHMPMGAEGELAAPRIGEMTAMLVDAAPPEAMRWDPSRAQGRRENAERQARARAGFLGRSGLKKAIDLAQTALIAHAQARDALAFVLAATRHWAQAAAAEGMSDARIQHPDEIFMLEIEEIKQMMTGEWHSREQIAPLIARRQEERRQQSVADSGEGVGPLGVAGEMVEGALLPLPAPDQVTPPSGFIALAESWSPVWWRVILMSEGVIGPGGDLLSWIASVARAGDLPALTGETACAAWASGTTIRLDPGRNQVEKAA